MSRPSRARSAAKKQPGAASYQQSARHEHSPDSGPSRATALIAVALVAIAVIVYAPALGAGFIWDDGRAITDNLALRSWSGLVDIWLGRVDFDYFPLKSTALWLLYQCFGARTSPYHVFNVAVHAACALALWQVLRRLRVPGAAWAALVFVVHPTHAESVAWVSECKNTLSTLFALLSVWAWLGHDERPKARVYLASLGFFVAALLCKTQVVVLPIVLLLCAWWRRQQTPDTQPISRLSALRRTLPFFAVALLLGAITVHFQFGRAIAEYQLPIGKLPSRVANAGKASWWYLEKAISPVIPWYEMPARPIETEPEAAAYLAGMRPATAAPAWPKGELVTWPTCMIYRQWRVTAPVWYDYLPALAMAALAVWVIRKRNGRAKGVFFAFAYFLVALAPVLGLVKLSYMRAAWVADHFQYLANIGIIAFVCAAGARLWQRSARGMRAAVLAVGAGVTAAFAVATFVRAADYQSEPAMWTDTVAKNPRAVQAQARLGAALLAQGDVARAAAHFTEAVRLKPDEPDHHNNLGIALVSQGKIDEGIAHYRESIRQRSQQFFAHANLGDALVAKKSYADAAAEYRIALAFNPDLVPLLFRLGEALAEGGNTDEATATLERAAALAPGTAEITQALERARSLKRKASSPSP